MTARQGARTRTGRADRSLAEREESVRLAEQSLSSRARALELREEALRAQEQALKADLEATASSDAQLREANEQLVVATVNAQTMTEVAEQATAQMSYMAEHDVLTGLPNRALLTDRLEQSMALALRHSRRVALLFVDLDHFKHVNDSLGHSVGDQLLQSAARRLQSCVRLSDTVSRQGGDEFLVLLPEVKAVEDAALIADKLIRAMAEPHLIGGQWLHVGLSIGICLYPDDAKDVGTVLKNADTAMYYAKKSGRNQYQLFTQDMNVRAVARQSVEQALHLALEQNGFVLHYQPKVNLQTGVITGAEALIRLQPPGKELVAPLDFVRVAEDCGLILPIGGWVLREACRQTAAWVQAGLHPGQIAVNVSALELHGRDFLAGVRDTLAETALDPRLLELELTESGLIQDTDQTTKVLGELKALGVQIAVDDFGTGYSSLSYLRRFPIDTLKIDQSFVQDITGDAGNAIVSAVMAMGTSLGQRVVAEGIETPHQLAFLQSLRCSEGQGYLFSRPVPADAFAALLAPCTPRAAWQPARLASR